MACFEVGVDWHPGPEGHPLGQLGDFAPYQRDHDVAI